MSDVRNLSTDNSCPDPAQLEAHVRGELTEAEIHRIESHISNCAACRLQVEAAGGDTADIFARVRDAFPNQSHDPDAGDRDNDESATLDAGAKPERPLAGRLPTIDGYEIIHELHRGGQGVVYQAIQKSTKRKVAIKLLLEGAYASKSARRRFEREIELVAQLKHPNIIAVFDSGETRDGHAYCVMDYIRGLPLDQHVREKKLNVEAAMALFSKVCEAVNYAHQRGVIHRDLKPSNILVDIEGSPRVLDFGLAKQTLSPDASLVSMTGQIVGTLPYMSPEQARGAPDEIDIRTDIYALGVILYELLTGQYPYPVVGQMAAVLQHIAETEPTPPSRQWKSGSGISDRSVSRRRTGACPIDDEIQTIVLKALAKERERRYQSAGGLASDIGNYLTGQPIDAKRDSGWYVLKKTVRKYRVPVGIAVAAVILISVSLVGAVALWRQAESARAEAETAVEQQRLAAERAENARVAELAQRKLAQAAEAKERSARQEAEAARADAQQRADDLQKVTQFQQSMLGEIDAMQMGVALYDDLRTRVSASLNSDPAPPEDVETIVTDFDATLRRANPTDVALELINQNVLRPAIKVIETNFTESPTVRAALQRSIAAIYGDFSLYSDGLPLAVAAYETHQSEFGDEHEETLQSRSAMARLLSGKDGPRSAEPHFREILEIRKRTLGDIDEKTLESMDSLAVTLQGMDRLDEALTFARTSLDGKKKTLGPNHSETLRAIEIVGTLLVGTGNLDEAESHYRKVVDERRRVLSADHPDTPKALENLGMLLTHRGKYAEAEPLLREALEIRRTVLGSNHLETTHSMVRLAELLTFSGRLQEAEPIWREVVEIRKRTFGEDHAFSLNARVQLASAIWYSFPDEAIQTLKEVIPKLKEVRGESHSDTLNAIHYLGWYQWTMGEYQQAELAMVEVLQQRIRIHGNEHPNIFSGKLILAQVLRDAGKYVESEQYFREALAGFEKVYGKEHRQTMLTEGHLGWLLKMKKDHANGEPLMRKTLATRKRVFGSDDVDTQYARCALASLLTVTGGFTEAEALLLEASKHISKLPPSNELHAVVGRFFFDLYTAWHKAEPNQGYGDKAIEWEAKQLDYPAWLTREIELR